MSDPPRRVPVPSTSVSDGVTRLSLNDDAAAAAAGGPEEGPKNDFVDGHENPVAWHKVYGVRGDCPYKDVLWNNLDMRDSTLGQYSGRDQPEYIKWKLFGYNLVICYEYIFQGNTDSALETLMDIENILKSIGNNDSFLKSIKIALHHITFSMKGYVLKLCSLETVVGLEPFVMPIKMNKVNKAGIYGVQSLFFYAYDLSCAQIAKNCALKAILLNENEAEWYYLLAKILTKWQRLCGNYFEVSEREIQAAEMAVQLGKNDNYKIHLVYIYNRMNTNFKNNEETKNKMFERGLQLLNEVIKNSSNDLFLLKNCLLCLSKLGLNKYDGNINKLLNQLIQILQSSDNGYIHGAIGNHYLYYKKDYEKANFHLKKAYDVKSFGSSFDYIYSLFKINPETAPVEKLLVEMLKSFHHPIRQEKIISQIISYLIMTKKNLIQALKYVPMLLSLKHITCVYSLQKHQLKFTESSSKPINLIDLLSSKLNAALYDQTISEDHIKRVKEVIDILELYKEFISKLMGDKKSHIFGNNFKMQKHAKTNKPYFNKDSKDSWTSKYPKQEKPKTEENWRTLKPDQNPNPKIFSRTFQKQLSSSGMEVKSRWNSQK